VLLPLPYFLAGWNVASIRRIASLPLMLCAAATTLRAQGYDDRLPNVVTAGFGGLNGGLGVSYRRLLGAAPISLGLGYGAWGPAAGIDLTIGSNRSSWSTDPGGRRLALGAALVINERLEGEIRDAIVLVEFSSQAWPGLHQRFFGEVGFGVILTPFGEFSGLVIPVMIRAQAGIGF